MNKGRALYKFVDTIRVKFTGGKGGDGCISFLHLFANEFAGPDGGNGGNGGHVILKADKNLRSLNKLVSAYQGNPGEPGMGKNMYGRSGEHLIISVPIGTTVRLAKPKNVSDIDYDPDKSDIIAELDENESMFIAARGGAGGKGNMSYLSNSNRHPRQAEVGGFGERNVYDLRMKLYAHIGLIGMPNAGKSTLLKTMTSANVEIGEYAFTTLYPQVGTLEYDDYSQVAISDLPGLIEESSKNRGLGIQFLRHVERCVSLVYVIDLTVDKPENQLEILLQELKAYKESLASKPHLIIGNKIDDKRARDNLPLFQQYLKQNWPDVTFITVSTLTGENLEEVRMEFKKIYDVYVSKNLGEPDVLIW